MYMYICIYIYVYMYMYIYIYIRSSPSATAPCFSLCLRSCRRKRPVTERCDTGRACKRCSSSCTRRTSRGSCGASSIAACSRRARCWCTPWCTGSSAHLRARAFASTYYIYIYKYIHMHMDMYIRHPNTRKQGVRKSTWKSGLKLSSSRFASPYYLRAHTL